MIRENKKPFADWKLSGVDFTSARNLEIVSTRAGSFYRFSRPSSQLLYPQFNITPSALGPLKSGLAARAFEINESRNVPPRGNRRRGAVEAEARYAKLLLGRSTVSARANKLAEFSCSPTVYRNRPTVSTEFNSVNSFISWWPITVKRANARQIFNRNQ